MKMELWIRSQDKEDLIKVDNIGLAYLGKYGFVDKIGDIHRGEYHICQFGENCHTTLGYYKTKERALEVLDEIQKQFDFKIKNKCYEEADLLLKANMFPKIYQMPDKG